jgi:hypothetical protein
MASLLVVGYDGDHNGEGVSYSETLKFFLMALKNFDGLVKTSITVMVELT